MIAAETAQAEIRGGKQAVGLAVVAVMGTRGAADPVGIQFGLGSRAVGCSATDGSHGATPRSRPEIYDDIQDRKRSPPIPRPKLSVPHD